MNNQMPNEQELRDKIITCLREEHCSIADKAREMKLPHSTIMNFVFNRRKTSVKTLFKIQNYLSTKEMM
jgi:hypothetical protein